MEELLANGPSGVNNSGGTAKNRASRQMNHPQKYHIADTQLYVATQRARPSARQVQSRAEGNTNGRARKRNCQNRTAQREARPRERSTPKSGTVKVGRPEKSRENSNAKTALPTIEHV